MKIQVLLSSYNGEKYIRDQIESILAQTQPGINILVRDDGSTDHTKEILDEYVRRGKLSWYEGENLGPGRSFWKLLQDSEDADYYAFCDQDDVWDPDKLETAVKALENQKKDTASLRNKTSPDPDRHNKAAEKAGKTETALSSSRCAEIRNPGRQNKVAEKAGKTETALSSSRNKAAPDPGRQNKTAGKTKKERPGIPLLYCSDVRVVDKDLKPIADHMLARIPSDYPHSLVRNIAPGCTFVFNRAAREILCRLDPDKNGVGLYDWTAYQIIACFGSVLFDPQSHMCYRQHGHNTIGAVTNIHKERLRKIKRFWSGDKKNSRQQNALRLERAFGRKMSPANREITRAFAYYKKNPKYRWRLLTDRTTCYPGAEYLFFKLLILFNKL